MKRALGLYFPFLSTDRLPNVREAAEGRGLAGLARGKIETSGDEFPSLSESAPPLATMAPQAGVLRLVHVNQAAYRLRLRSGQTLADAKALVPNLDTCNDDPIADRRQLETLAVWAGCLSPTVHLEGTDTLLLDVTGCKRLFKGEDNLLRRAMDGLSALGFTVRGAIADTAGAAWAIAHAHHEAAVVSTPGQVVADLVPLPVWSLRVDDKTTDALASVGVDSVGSLLHLPRSSLTSRFGDALLDRIDQALGNLPEVLTAYQPQPAITSRISFGTATTRMDLFQEAIRQTLDRFCSELARKVAGVRQLFVTFYCPDVPTEQGSQTRTVTLPASLSEPTRSAKHLYALLVVLLDKLHLPAPAHAMMLWARETDPLDGWQDELFATDSKDGRQLGDLVDRLAVRLGSDRVVQPVLLSEHQPERAFRYRPLVQSRRMLETGVDLPGPRPLRLLPHPHKIVATALVPEGPPMTFRVNGSRHVVARSIGPERIETGWWRGPHVKRDYYRIRTTEGCHVWLFRDRDDGRWFLHGWFD